MQATLDEHSIWKRYVAERRPEDRDALVRRYADLARKLAARMFADRHIREIEFDEYHHYALVGLLEALDRFELGRGASFSTYAGHRIRGAILNGIEKYSEKQQQIVARSRLREERFKALLEEASEPDADPFMRLAEMAIGTAIGFMLEDSPMYQGGDEAAGHDVYRGRELRDIARVLGELVDKLPETEQKIMRYHYYQHVRFDDIAGMLKLSKGRVSQLHRRALQRLQTSYEQLRLLRIDY